MDMSKKTLVTFIVALLILLIGFFAWFFFYKKPALQEANQAALEKEGLGGSLYDKTLEQQNVINKLPDTNPFTGVETNPFKQGYTNPFE